MTSYAAGLHAGFHGIMSPCPRFRALDSHPIQCRKYFHIVSSLDVCGAFFVSDFYNTSVWDSLGLFIFSIMNLAQLHYNGKSSRRRYLFNRTWKLLGLYVLENTDAGRYFISGLYALKTIPNSACYSYKVYRANKDDIPPASGCAIIKRDRGAWLDES